MSPELAVIQVQPPGSWSILSCLPGSLGRQESWGLFPECQGQGGWGQGRPVDKQIKGEAPRGSRPGLAECTMRWVEAPRVSPAGVRGETGPHRPSPALSSGCWSPWVCCGARQPPRPRARSGPSPCSGAWHLLASQARMPTTTSSTGP